MLKLARCVGDSFISPNRHIVGRRLFYLNFKRKGANVLANLIDKADVFGLTFLGDVATVNSMPLMNSIL